MSRQCLYFTLPFILALHSLLSPILPSTLQLRIAHSILALKVHVPVSQFMLQSRTFTLESSTSRSSLAFHAPVLHLTHQSYTLRISFPLCAPISQFALVSNVSRLTVKNSKDPNAERTCESNGKRDKKFNRGLKKRN